MCVYVYVCMYVSVDVTEGAYISRDVPSNRHRTSCIYVYVCTCMYICVYVLMYISSDVLVFDIGHLVCMCACSMYMYVLMLRILQWVCFP